jgi:hypothetical protein
MQCLPLSSRVLFIYTEFDPVGVFCTVGTDAEAASFVPFDNEDDYPPLSNVLNFRSKLQFVIDFFHLSDQSFAYMLFRPFLKLITT